MEEEKRETLISIIVPVFRVEKELPRCMNSLLQQTEKCIEIILVDDGSDDGCPAMCDKYAAKDARVRVIHKTNGGLSDARNAGLSVMRGTWCLFVDADDYLDIDTCERLLAVVQKAGNADIVAGECEEHHGDTSIFQRHTNLEEGKLYSASEYMKHVIPRGEFYLPAWLNLYRTDWLRQHQFQFAKGLLHEDLEWTPRIFLAEPKIVYMKGAFYHYVVRDGSICKAKDFTKHISDCMKIYHSWKEQFALVEDPEMKRELNGFLCKSLIHTCAHYQVMDWKKRIGISRWFLLKNSTGGFFSKLLVILFVLNTACYIRLYKIKNKEE